MQNKTLLRIQYASRAAAFTLADTGALVITGCGAASLGKQAVPVSGATLQGHVFGGQQPVSGSVIQLYAANQLAYGQSSAPLIASTVTTDAGGSFSITGDYTCPYPSSQVYITATGGDTGSGTNANIALMAPLGACGNRSGLGVQIGQRGFAADQRRQPTQQRPRGGHAAVWRVETGHQMVVEEKPGVGLGALGDGDHVARAAELQQHVSCVGEPGRQRRRDMVRRAAKHRGAEGQAGRCRGIGSDGADALVRGDQRRDR